MRLHQYKIARKTFLQVAATSNKFHYYVTTCYLTTNVLCLYEKMTSSFTHMVVYFPRPKNKTQFFPVFTNASTIFNDKGTNLFHFFVLYLGQPQR